MIIDLRSDTLTQPSPEMREAMIHAKLGDDVFGEDPTINELESYAAELFGMDAALFCPSGTMTNQIAIRLHTEPGAEVIVDETSHTYLYEGGGIAFLSGASVRLLKGDRGRITADQILENINPDNIHMPVTQLVSLENTHNKGGGSIYDVNEIIKISALCREKDLKIHLDGARLFNAIAETGESPKTFGNLFDSISICLSKGLGAPVGSLLICSHENKKKAKRIRKVLGGGMRQAGILAAAGLFALRKNTERLKNDHALARLLSNAIKEFDWVEKVFPAETNIIIFILKKHVNPSEFLTWMETKGIRAVHFGGQAIRMVTHLDVNEKQILEAISILKKY